MSSDPAKYMSSLMSAESIKGPTVGNHVSHAHNLTKRRWMPNLQTVRVNMDGKTKRIKVCTRCMRSGKVQKAL